MSKFYMTNIIWYDGQNAYVSKFILECDKIFDIEEDKPMLTQRSEGLIGQYLSGNGEFLKADILYPVNLDNVVALKSYKNSAVESERELFAAYDRFNEMYF